MKTIQSLGEIAGHYDAVISDVWGVVHDGLTAFAEGCAALERFRAERGPVLLLSNAPRPGESVAARMDEMGVPRAAYDGILTSGDAARAEMAGRTGQGFYFLGPERDRPIFDGLQVRETVLAQASFILNSGLADDEVETPESYGALLAEAKALNLPMLCANPDRVVHRGARLIWCAGALAEAYEALGGSVTYFGKPHPPIYDAALAQLNGIAGREIDDRRILAVGDGIRTDVLGANRAGLDVLFVSAGIHGEAFGPRDAPDHAKIVGALEAEEAFAAASITRLRW